MKPETIKRLNEKFNELFAEAEAADVGLSATNDVAEHKCPNCGGELECLGGCSAHWSNWYCADEKNCGYQAWDKSTIKDEAMMEASGD